MAREFAALMLLPCADVVVARTGTAVGRRSDHMRPALAPKQTREEVNPALRLLDIQPPIDRLADLELHAVELLPADDRLMAVLFHRITPPNHSQVDGIAEDAGYLLLCEELAAAKLVRTGAKCRIADAQFVQPPCHRPGRAKFLEQVEDTADDGRSFLVDLQLARIILQ